MNPVIIIPARMASTRLPGKPLADIAGQPMIVRVLSRVRQAGYSHAVVACDGDAIKSVVEKAGGRAVLTNPDLPSGSDRIYKALAEIDHKREYDVVVNVQGDMPTLDASIIKRILEVLKDPSVDIATAASIITDAKELSDPAVVKIALAMQNEKQGRALYFSRATIPHGAKTHYHHIGIYAYRRKALERFIGLAPSSLEQSEKLEQLRALEAGMHIGVAVVDTVPLGVDTQEALQVVRKWYEQNN